MPLARRIRQELCELVLQHIDDHELVRWAGSVAGPNPVPLSPELQQLGPRHSLTALDDDPDSRPYLWDLER